MDFGLFMMPLHPPEKDRTQTFEEDSACIIRMYYWYTPPNYWDFLAMGEKVNLEVFRAFEQQGIRFALPLRVSHTSVDSQEKPVDVNLVDRPPLATR